MAISTDLFMAILAMDAYNRGYNAGVGDPNTGLAGTQIGNATIGSNSAILGVGVDEAASFYAQSYTWNGQTVISYRGTDDAMGRFAGDIRTLVSLHATVGGFHM